MPHSKAVKTGSSDGNGSLIHSLSRNLKFLKEWIHFSFNSWGSIRNSSSTILFSCWCLESQGVFKKREGVWGKTSRRLDENTKAFLTVHISLPILILPRQDTISYCDKISNLTATRLLIFRRKLILPFLYYMHSDPSFAQGTLWQETFITMLAVNLSLIQ